MVYLSPSSLLPYFSIWCRSGYQAFSCRSILAIRLPLSVTITLWSKRGSQCLINVIVLGWLCGLDKAILRHWIFNPCESCKCNVELVESVRVVHRIITTKAHRSNSGGGCNRYEEGIRAIPVRYICEASHDLIIVRAGEALLPHPDL